MPSDNEFTRILQWPGYRVYRHKIDEKSQILELWVRRKRGNRKLECSGCGRKFQDAYDSNERSVRDLPWSAFRTTVHIEVYRVRAHVMVAFLGYALWVTLKHLLKRRPTLVPQASTSGVHDAQSLSAMKALALLSTLQSADIVLPTTDGREIRLRRITEPTAEQKLLLQQLGLSLPDHFELHRKCSADLAIA